LEIARVHGTQATLRLLLDYWLFGGILSSTLCNYMATMATIDDTMVRIDFQRNAM
jgi:hypothetical protein